MYQSAEELLTIGWSFTSINYFSCGEPKGELIDPFGFENFELTLLGMKNEYVNTSLDLMTFLS